MRRACYSEDRHGYDMTALLTNETLVLTGADGRRPFTITNHVANFDRVSTESLFDRVIRYTTFFCRAK